MVVWQKHEDMTLWARFWVKIPFPFYVLFWIIVGLVSLMVIVWTIEYL